MKEILKSLVSDALDGLKERGEIVADVSIPAIHIEHTKDKKFGDYSCNIAMMLAKPLKQNPRTLGERIIGVFPASKIVKKVELAGPGFINIYLDPKAYHYVLEAILTRGQAYGQCNHGRGRRVLIEYVSANPTGPLHVGHGRGAAFGASVANLLAEVGYDVDREYYVNDAGRQMHILATSVWLRYLQAQGVRLPFPQNGYRGDYIEAIAKKIAVKPEYLTTVEALFDGVPDDLNDDETAGDKEAHIDALIEKAKAHLGEAYAVFFKTALEDVLEDIKADLKEFGVEYQQWFSEQALMDNNALQDAVQALKAKGVLYEQDGALWFRATDFGDDKDRVLLRANGTPTYFANDVAYHVNKYNRGYDVVIDIFGADHHGYVKRVEAALHALGHGDKDFKVLLVQFANLFRHGERVQMSTRSGKFVTIRELREEVGNDAARFFYVMRKNEQHMDFDLDLAKSQSNDNPLYYVQYAHARISSVFRQLVEAKQSYDQEQGLSAMSTLTLPYEEDLIQFLAKFEERLLTAAMQFEPHTIATYARELASYFHTYYNSEKFLVDDEAMRNARLVLCKATQVILKKCLAILGVSAPDKM